MNPSDFAYLDPELPFYDVHIWKNASTILWVPAAPVLLSIGFGGVALFLAAIGIYGVLAYVVAQRTEEIGIRIALGSTAEALFRLILKEGGVMLGIGFVLGLAGALAVGQVGRGRPLRSEARESRRAGRDDRHSGARGLCTAGQAGHPGDPAITLRQE